MGSIYDWSTTASDNGASDATVNFAEGQTPASLNNSARAVMARVAAWLKGLGAAITHGGSSNAYTLTLPTGHTITAYATGMRFLWKPNGTSSGNVTLNVDGVGAKKVYLPSGSQAGSGQIVSGTLLDVVYDATLDSSSGGFQIVGATTTAIGAQPLDATLTALAALSHTSGTLAITMTGTDTFALATFGTAASATIGTSGDTVPKNNTANTFSDTFTVDKGAGGATTLNVGGANNSTAYIDIRANAAQQRILRFLTGTSSRRWQIMVHSDAESGANAGSNFRIDAYDDSNAAIGTAINLNRATLAATFGGPILAPAGSAAAPGIAGSGDTNTGWEFAGSDVFYACNAGARRFRFTTTTFQAEGDYRVLSGEGSASTPAISNRTDTNTGRRFTGSDVMYDCVGGADVAQIDSAGYKDASGNLWQVGGKHLIPLRAAAFTAQTTNGAAAYSAELTTNDQMITGFAFDKDADEFIQLEIPMPKSWNEGTFTARFRWYAPSGSGNVVWGIQALCVGDDDALDAAWGTAQTVTDALTATGDLMITAETSAVTAAGSPAEGDTLILRVYRDADNGSDTFSADAILLGVDLFISIAGSNDA